jgi:hypothetical protein
MGASVIAGVDAAAIFESAEHVLDPVRQRAKQSQII